MIGGFTPEYGVTVHVLRCVLEMPVTTIMVLHGVERYRLKSSPAEAKYQRVLSLQYLTGPPVLLKPSLKADMKKKTFISF